MKIRLKAHPKMPFCGPPGRLIVEADYSSQELRIGAALSNDPAMVTAYTVGDELEDEEGNKYKNPDADIHCLSSVYCIDPEWFEGIPKKDWVLHSKRVRPGQSKCPRDLGKTLNFASVYLSTARSIAERNYIKLETAIEWERRHRETYAGYYAWAAEVGRIAKARGYAINNEARWRWVDEANAKGAGESIERNAVNHMVQSLGADMTKEADLRCTEYFKGEDVYGVLAVHDALVFEIPGQFEILWDQSEQKKGVWTSLKYRVNKEAEEIANKIVEIMEEVETEMFEALGSPIKGAAEAGIKPFWSH